MVVQAGLEAIAARAVGDLGYAAKVSGYPQVVRELVELPVVQRRLALVNYRPLINELHEQRYEYRQAWVDRSECT